MTRSNPPPHIRLTPEIRKNRALADVLDKLAFDMFLLWKRTGGSTDSIEEGEQVQTSTNSRVSRNAARINSLELKEFEIIPTTVSLTAEEFQIIVCKNVSEITITLDPDALEGDEVHIKRRGGSVIVAGSIDGFTNKTINVLNYSMHLVFDGADWSEI